MHEDRQDLSCWFWNIDSRAQQYFADELKAGRLRQGWGYAPNLDLRKLKQKLVDGNSLDSKEQEAWSRCGYMVDAIKPGDLVVVKNAPDRDKFTIAKVVGPYGFTFGFREDYEHVLPVETVAVYHKYSKAVPTTLTNALNREQHPIRRTLKHQQAVYGLASPPLPASLAAERLQPQPFKEKLSGWREKLVPHLRAALQRDLSPSEAERLVGELLKREGMDVFWTAGAYERGADLRCDADVGLGVTYRLAVQVKMHWGEDNDLTGVGQLVTALGAHDAKAGILVTMADKLGPDLLKELDAVNKEHNIHVLYGADLFSRLLELITDQGLKMSE